MIRDYQAHIDRSSRALNLYPVSEYPEAQKIWRNTRSGEYIRHSLRGPLRLTVVVRYRSDNVDHKTRYASPGSYCTILLVPVRWSDYVSLCGIVGRDATTGGVGEFCHIRRIWPRNISTDCICPLEFRLPKHSSSSRPYSVYKRPLHISHTSLADSPSTLNNIQDDECVLVEFSERKTAHGVNTTRYLQIERLVQLL